MKNIKIIEHRGGWCKDTEENQKSAEQNSLEAFCNSLKRKNGIETDLRDISGEIVISHDMPSGNEMSFDKLLSLLREKFDHLGTLALNTKADGMQEKLKTILAKHKVEDYFTFDILASEVLSFAQHNLKYYLRQSDYEPNPKTACFSIYKGATGIWLDQLEAPEPQKNYISEKVISTHLDQNKKVAIASPELHLWAKNYPYRLIWDQYKKIFNNLSKEGYNLEHISICTDFPKKAKEFFCRQ